MEHTFGPINSRRLGRSFGVDLVPYKYCSFDCVYCQLGRTTDKTLTRRRFFSEEEIIKEIRNKLQKGLKTDYITFSGSGEPTLSLSLGRIIREIKKLTETPVAVLTNGSLLFKKPVREALKEADLVSPSLDAANQELFRKLNRPPEELEFERFIQGLIDFRQEFNNRYVLEVMLIRDLNDSIPHLEKLNEWINKIEPDRVDINTPVRPPLEDVDYLEVDELKELATHIDLETNIVTPKVFEDFSKPEKSIAEEVMSILERRPESLENLTHITGEKESELLKIISGLEHEGKIREIKHGDKNFYKLINE